MESELGRALDQTELELYYQPKIDLKTGNPCGAEALMRWNHPTRGLVLPDVFIPVADRTGNLEPMTWYAINTALRQQSEWPELWGELSVAVNLSVNVLKSKQLSITIRDAEKIWGSESHRLILEITEDALISDPDKGFSILRQLQSEGIRIAIDDFGTGYSSMSHFRDMPADELKIDKSFVLNMLDDERDRQIVRTAIDLGHTFGFAVVAEGVENEAIRNELIDMKCDIAQGYLYARPMPQQEFIEWLNQYQPGKSAEQELDSSVVLAVATDKNG
jgi:EAL domain-containing protein (putative c-di-GMP-specific phosphodiesterase class I)